MIMKKILLLLSVFALFSCEQEELDGSVLYGEKQVKTTSRAVDSFNLLRELEGIPVNILNVGNIKNKYLSCAKKGTTVDLYNQDDGSLRQRWYIKNSNSIYLVGGHENSSKYPIVKIAPADRTEEPRPFLGFAYMSVDFDYTWNEVGGYYNIKILPPLGPSLDGSVWPQKELFLQSESNSGTSLRFKASNPGELAQWAIAPVGSFKIKDIEYIQQAATDVIRRDQVVATDVCENDRDEDIIYHFSVSGGYSESSEFNQSKSISTKITTEVSVGIPNIIGGKATGEQDSSKTWSYGESKNKTYSIQRTIDIPIKKRSTMALEALMESYDVDILYIATLQDVTDERRTFKVKGRWSGQKACTLYTRVYDKYTKALMGTYFFNGE